MASNSFGTEVSPSGAGLVDRSFGAEETDLRADIESGFAALEAGTGFPELEWLDLAAAAGITAAGTVDIICRGAGLLNSGAYATVDVATLTLDAVVPGTTANTYTVEIVDTGTGGLTITMTTTDLVIDQGGSASDEDTVATAINDAAADTFGLIRANSAAAGAMAVAAQVPMAGGLGDDFVATIVGIACPLLHPVGAATAAASMSDTSITLNPPALTAGGAAAGDVGQVRLTCNGVRLELYAVLV